MSTELSNVRERLIDAGIQELNAHGVRDFSVRRVATSCGLSCAAPYKHFDDKNDFIASIIEYLVSLWESRIPEIIHHYPNDLRSQLLETSVAYVQFLVENSHFRSIIMLKDPQIDRQYALIRLRLSATARELIRRYADQLGAPPEIEAFKLYVIRSLIYGAALMFDCNELAYTQENLDMVRRSIDRELTYPDPSLLPK